MEPILLPLNAEMSAYYVQIWVHGKEISFNMLNVPSSTQDKKTSLKNVKLQGDTELRNLLAGSEHLVQQRLNQNADVEEFALEMRDLLENAIGFNSNAMLPSTMFYRKVYSELGILGWENIVCLSSDLSAITIRLFDQRGRDHVAEITLPSNYPEAEPTISAELPVAFELEWSKDANLSNALNQFNEVIEKFQDFWNVMEDFDKNVWVMEPLHPSRGSSFRRIALGGHCSVSLTVNACSPRSVPECRFFGSDIAIAPLRKKWNSSLRKWRAERLPRENIEDILEITFPSRQRNAGDEDISADCGICYAFHLPHVDEQGIEGTTIPDRACDNPNCGRPFHSECLVEWLRSIQTTRQSFDVLFGSCPYCSHSIAVKAPLS